MLKCSLNFSDVVGTASNVHCPFLWVFYTKSEAGSFIKAFPSTTGFQEIAPTFFYANTNILIVENSSIKFQEVYEMLSKVYILCSTFFVLFL